MWPKSPWKMESESGQRARSCHRHLMIDNELFVFSNSPISVSQYSIQQLPVARTGSFLDQSQPIVHCKLSGFISNSLCGTA